MSRSIVMLNGSAWRLGQAPKGAVPGHTAWEEIERVSEWLPATVPGNVQADLMAAGRLPDLTVGRNNEQAQWIDDHCWWLIRDFSWPADSPAGTRTHLVLRGVDYISDVFLNGQHLGRHEGMFSPQTYEVTGRLAAENRLAVRIAGSRWLPTHRSSAWEKVLNHLESAVREPFSRFPHRRDTVKCQMSFGWDFAPSLRAIGIWDDAYLVSSQDVFIGHVAASSRLDDGGMRLSVAVEIHACQAGQVIIHYSLSGAGFGGPPIAAEQPLRLEPGMNRYQAKIDVPEPRLWWPWDHGRPDLYDLSVRICSAAGDRELDAAGERIGLRQIDLDGLNLIVNGRRVYARGANWVPADVLPGRVTENDYRELLTLARAANMNTLRVWGGGLREKQAFYRLCDEMGLLVWQEFPLACAFGTRYPRTPEYLALVEAETRAIVRDLRNHPSVLLWCGGNEFSPDRNRPVVEAMGRAAAEDGSRPFWPASPHRLDSHNWSVWHCFEAPSAYRRDLAGFASEFGMQAPPSVESLRRFIPEGELWPPGPSWTYHHAGLNKLARYARPFLRPGQDGIESFVRASQRAQALGLQIAIEHYRRRKAEGCGGALLWQLNEPWPAISWALLDYYRRCKPAYKTVKRVFSPILISLDYPLRAYGAGDSVALDVWLINDTVESMSDCELEIRLVDDAGKCVEVLRRGVEVTPSSARIVDQVSYTLPSGENWRLTCRLAQGGQVLSENEYYLAEHDGLGPSRWLKMGIEIGKDIYSGVIR